MQKESGLGRTRVVRGDDEQTVRSGASRVTGEFDTVGGVVAPGACNDLRAVADGVDHCAEQVELLGLGGGGRLTGRAGKNEAVAAVVDEMGCEAHSRVDVQLPVGSERGHHRNGNGAERTLDKRSGITVGHGQKVTRFSSYFCTRVTTRPQMH